MSDQPSRPADHALPLSDLALESMPFPMNLDRPDGLIDASNAGVERLFAYRTTASSTPTTSTTG